MAKDRRLGVGILGAAAIAKKNVKAIGKSQNGVGAQSYKHTVPKRKSSFINRSISFLPRGAATEARSSVACRGCCGGQQDVGEGGSFYQGDRS